MKVTAGSFTDNGQRLWMERALRAERLLTEAEKKIAEMELDENLREESERWAEL